MIKVYGSTNIIKKEIYRVIVATTSLTKAQTLLNTNKAFISATRNKVETDLALENIGVVFYCLDKFRVAPKYVTKDQI